MRRYAVIAQTFAAPICAVARTYRAVAEVLDMSFRYVMRRYAVKTQTFDMPRYYATRS